MKYVTETETLPTLSITHHFTLHDYNHDPGLLKAPLPQLNPHDIC